MSQNSGVLLLNLGTPDAPRVPEVRRYLREFLHDPFVVDIPTAARWMLVNLIILPTRPKKSAEAYQKIWTDRGSPLMFHSLDLVAKVKRLLEGQRTVAFAMRYGKPNVATALAELHDAGVDRIVVLPLYPQYSLAATESSIDWVRREARRLGLGASLDFIPDFYADPGFLDAFAEVARPRLQEFRPDHVLFSYHGIPERHVRKTDPSGAHCLSTPDCCERAIAQGLASSPAAKCYRAQCFATTSGIASRLKLERSSYSIGFQSRLGRTPWIQPFTDIRLDELADAGVKRLSVLCPSFVADCLETIEEIGMRAREQFRERGGEDLQLVPSVNSEDAWARAVAALVANR